MSGNMRTDDRKLCLMLQLMLDGGTITELAEIAGSRATAYRYLNVLEEEYHVVIRNLEGSYKVISVGDENIWRVVFKELF